MRSCGPPGQQVIVLLYPALWDSVIVINHPARGGPMTRTARVDGPPILSGSSPRESRGDPPGDSSILGYAKRSPDRDDCGQREAYDAHREAGQDHLSGPAVRTSINATLP